MITRVRGQGQVELRAFALTDMVRWGYDQLRNVSPSLSARSVRGIPAIHRAARIRAEAVASLPMRVWRGEGQQRERIDTVWQSRLFRGQPNSYCSYFSFWETLGESLAYRNNAYVWKLLDPLTDQPFELYALHPDQVQCEGDGTYMVTVQTGYEDPLGQGPGRYHVGPETILHIRGHGDGGMKEAPTPIEIFREAFEAPLARQRHEVRMWKKGATLQAAVSFPQGVTKPQADEWKDLFRAAYTGETAETIPIIGQGGEIKPIGMTQADAQYVEMANLTVADAALIMNVPVGLLGRQVDPVPDLEQDLTLWMRTGLGPELKRIESALAADLWLFGPTARVQPGFDTTDFIMADVATEDAVAHQQVQDGRLLVDEWRIPRGLPPLPNGAGKVPQIVPVGGGPNPNTTPVPSSNGASAS